MLHATPPPAPPPAPIGILDSGVGGLSVWRALQAGMPGESFVYVADSGHAPYGDRPADFVLERAVAVSGFLVREGVKAIVLACNTASVVAAAPLRALHRLPIVAMEPAIKPAALATRSKTMLVLATTATIRSAAVARLHAAHGAGVHIVLQACPGLADQVERGQIRGEATRRLLEACLRPGLEAGADTIVLACTHYAFLVDEIARIAGPAVAVIEPSAAIARQLARVVAAAPEGLAPMAGTRFYTSGAPGEMAAFLGAIGVPAATVLALPPGRP